MTGAARCPACKGSVPAGAFQCPHCELLLVDLNDEAGLKLKPGEGSVVQALFERPRAAASRPRALRTSTRERPHAGALPAEGVRPRVLAGLQLSRMSLSRLEASVVGLCDGRLSVREIAGAAGLPVRETQGVLRGLAGIGVVALPPPLPRPEAVEEEEDGALATVKFDLNQLGDRVEQHRARVEQQRARPRSAPPPVPAPARAAPGPRPRGVGGGQNPLEQAIKLERSGRGLEALRYLELAISRSQDAAPLYNRLAIVLVRERLDFHGAERMLLKALALDPSHPVYKGNLSMVRQRKPIATHPMPTLKGRP